MADDELEILEILFPEGSLVDMMFQDILYQRSLAPPAPEPQEFADVVPDPDVHADGILTAQLGKVECLRKDQRLVIPYGLAHCFPTFEEPSEVPSSEKILFRFYKIAKIGFQECVRFVEEHVPAAKIREIVDSVTFQQIILANYKVKAYFAPEWYIVNGVQEGSRERIDIIMENVSQACNMNFDIRDLGALNRPGMRVSDDAWQHVQDYNADRLLNKLQPYTLASIAALNYPRVNNVAIAAWVRAYGIGCGILHDNESQNRIQYEFTTKHSDKEHKTMCNAIKLDHQIDLCTLSLNIISIFGLFHLNKNQTFRRDDSNTNRIAASYVKTLRTMAKQGLIDHIKKHLDPIVFTAAHPLGVAQTYWCAQAMRHSEALPPLLMLRCDATPPPVQRLMVVVSAVDEWATLPIGITINERLAGSIAQLRVEVARIKAKPPAFSELWRMYGVEGRLEVSEGVVGIVSKMMPLVYGFAKSMHVSEDGRHDGIALAMCLKDFERKNRVVARIYESMWGRYLKEHNAGGGLVGKAGRRDAGVSMVEAARKPEEGGLVETVRQLVAGLEIALVK